MTQEQAAQLIAQNDKLIEFYGQVLPFVQSALHDVFPLLVVAACLALGALFGMAATS